MYIVIYNLLINEKKKSLHPMWLRSPLPTQVDVNISSSSIPILKYILHIKLDLFQCLKEYWSRWESGIQLLCNAIKIVTLKLMPNIAYLLENHITHRNKPSGISVSRRVHLFQSTILAIPFMVTTDTKIGPSY